MKPPGIYPTEIPVNILEDPKRNAEVLVYRALEKLAEIGCHVFYSCDWIDHREDPVPSGDGEADFIIAHPDFGFLAIEVKGGLIGRNGNTGEWYRVKRDGVREGIKNPVNQARTSKHVILDQLKSGWGSNDFPYIRMKHAVVFPNSDRPALIDAFGASMPLSMFAFKQDMPDLGGYLVRLLLAKEGVRNRNFGKLGSKGIKLLHKLFTSSFELKTTLQSTLDIYDARITEQTAEQQRFLEYTSMQRKALVLGGAGTGKTFLALMKAIQFASEGYSTLVVYFNSPMAADAQRKLVGKNVTVKTFHQICIDAATAASITVSQEQNTKKFSEELPQALSSALSNGHATLYDAVVVDEAQDLEEDWLELCMLCLKDLESGKFFVFADDNQNLYGTGDNLASLMSVDAHALVRNVRNTKPIFQFSNEYYLGITNSSLDFEGPDVEFLNCENQALGKVVRHYLERLRDVEGVPFKNMAVLSCRSLQRSYIGDTLEDISVTAEVEPPEDRVTFDSVWRFKGLERQVVIITDIEEAVQNRELLYVAMSRARTLLVVFGTQTSVEGMSKLIGNGP